jgi:ribosomal protein L27
MGKDHTLFALVNGKVQFVHAAFRPTHGTTINAALYAAQQPANKRA